MTKPLDEFSVYQIMVELKDNGLLEHRINGENGVDEWRITKEGKEWIKAQGVEI